MNKKTALIGLFLILMVNFSFTNVNVNGSINAGNIYSTLATAPVIDGLLDDAVWDYAPAVNFVLYDDNNQSNTKDITIYSLYSSDNFTYIGGELEDIYYSYLGFAFLFETDLSTDIILSINETDITFGNNLDMKFIRADNIFIDGFKSGTGEYVDTENLGTNDMVAHITHSNGKYCFELAIPFDSGDINGKDISNTVNDELKFLIWYNGFDNYYQVRIDDLEWEYCTLIYLSPSTSVLNGVPIQIISLVSICGLAVMTILIKRKK